MWPVSCATGCRVASLVSVPAVTTDFDLAGLRLSPGEGRRLELWTRIDPLELGGERYTSEPAAIPVSLEVSRMTGHGYALRLRLRAALRGPCMRCLKEAAPLIEVDAREVDRPGTDRRSAGEELSSPYVTDEMLDLAAWARDAFALAAPVQVLCREDCRGLCPECAADLNDDLDPARPEHVHERAPDSRWVKLGDLKLS
jgi:uncharacterized protein